MARRQRIELEGGLYHLITRGNDRQDIFHSNDDHLKFLSLIAAQKERLGFYLYAYCLMTNHLPLLIERQGEAIGRIMQRLLTGYSQYYNRRYGRVGHVFQGRHKAILCQSQQYLTKLVRYIHLNPVRAKMVTTAEEYPYSSHRAYLGIEQSDIVDVDAVLRHFGNRKELARRHFAAYVGAGPESGEASYSDLEGDVLGTEEFVDEAIHRLGHVDKKVDRRAKPAPVFEIDTLMTAVEDAFGLSSDEICNAGKDIRTIMAKEVLILVGRAAGASVVQLSFLTGLDTSTISRRYDAAVKKLETDQKLCYAKTIVEQEYWKNVRESQA